MGTRELTGKVALVTGGGRGLGRGFAERLAALGASIALHGRRELGPAEYGEGISLTRTAQEISERHNVSTIRVIADLSQPDQVDVAVDEVIKHFGRIDILVHNAGGDIAANGGKADPNDAVMVKDDDARAILENNLQSTILICQRVARNMMQRRSGRIITVSSIASLTVAPDGMQAMYAVAKAAVNKYTKMLASQLLPHNINVNCIAPGPTKSGRFVATVKDGSQNAALKDPNVRAAYIQQLEDESDCIGRPGAIDEVARVVEFFAGPLGSFVTGEVLKVDGGVALL